MFVIPLKDPAVAESEFRAFKVAEYYLSKGEDTFTFVNEQGRAYVVTRKMGVEQYLAAGDKLIGFTTPRVIDVAGGRWSEPGRA
jgi:hypothetical protein